MWFDEGEIHVGDCIQSRIEEGIDGADFLVLLLSRHAVTSKWVEREWKAVHWAEVEKNAVALLPVLWEPCAIPPLLRSKKYADCTQSYDTGFRELTEAIRYFESLRSDGCFFGAIPTVWAEERRLGGAKRLARNRHWDRFEELVQSLPPSERQNVQMMNSLHYLEKYDLVTSHLKEQLSRLGFFFGPIDDEFNDEVTNALIEFQVAFNLRHVDGLFGPLTYLAMAEAAKNLG